jgi:hypothetical protein
MLLAGTDYEVVTAWVGSSQDVERLGHRAGELRAAMRGRHLAGFYFLWSVARLLRHLPRTVDRVYISSGPSPVRYGICHGGLIVFMAHFLLPLVRRPFVAAFATGG